MPHEERRGRAATESRDEGARASEAEKEGEAEVWSLLSPHGLPLLPIQARLVSWLALLEMFRFWREGHRFGAKRCMRSGSRGGPIRTKKEHKVIVDTNLLLNLSNGE